MSDADNAFTTALSCDNCGGEWDDAHPERTEVYEDARGRVVVVDRDCEKFVTRCGECCYYATCPTCGFRKHVSVTDREPV